MTQAKDSYWTSRGVLGWRETSCLMGRVWTRPGMAMLVDMAIILVVCIAATWNAYGHVVAACVSSVGVLMIVAMAYVRHAIGRRWAEVLIHQMSQRDSANGRG